MRSIEKELIAAERPSPESDVGVTLTTHAGLHRAACAISPR